MSRHSRLEIWPLTIPSWQVILESILLRRQKNTKDSAGKPIVELPPKIVGKVFLIPQFCAFLTWNTPCQVEVETLEFSVSERKLYDSIYIDVRKKFERLNAKGLVNKNYTSILAMLMRHGGLFPLYWFLVLIFLETQAPSGSSSPSPRHDAGRTRRTRRLFNFY